MSTSSANRIRNVMRGNRSRDTRPELAVRRELFARGMRYRVNSRPDPNLRRTADVVFTRARVVIFIDGCFWHGCPLHYVPAKSNTTYWNTKIGANVARDLETTSQLIARGWIVLRFWSHEDPEKVAERIFQVVASRAGMAPKPADIN